MLMLASSFYQRLKTAAASALLLPSLLLVSLWLTWQLLAQVNFAYSVAYTLLDIGDVIEFYGPDNKFKDNFALTDKSQHLQLFAQIVTAIQNQGQGLADIHYTPEGGSPVPLLHQSEIIHLQDVADLISHFNHAAGAALLVLVLLIVVNLRWKLPLPSNKSILRCTAAMGAVAAAMLGMIGPTNVFYWLHQQIFPPGHQWFFYYEDSLMTTLMKAPDLFGFIAALWLVLTLLSFSVALGIWRRRLAN